MSVYPRQVIKGYEILEEVGAGGFGTVYRAFQPVVGREVAIKVILLAYTQNPEFVRRFEVEARLIARLEHPHIVPLYDYWCEPEGTFLVMRWLPHTLRSVLADGVLPPESAIRLLDQMAAALSVAHRNQIIHRDIKPDNILLDEDNNAYLADFGIAKDLNQPNSTKENTIAGTLAYLTPEQINGAPVSPQTDLYSLGLVVYEALTGEKPFGEVAPSTLIFKQLNEPLPSLRTRRPDLPPALDAVLQKVTAKDPAGRYPDAPRFADAFRAAIAMPPPKIHQPLPDPLTERELAILRLIAADCSNAEIAQQLFISAGTVKWYVKQIYSKLDAHSRDEAIARGNALKLIVQGVTEPALPPAVADEATAIVPATIPISPAPSVQTVFNLPVQAMPFVGRDEELAALASLLADPAVRLVTILAPGGMGKTRLAIEAADRHKTQFTHGACLVALAPLNGADHLLSAIAQAVHFTFYGGSDPKQQLLDYLHQKQLLLVLDNFEHLLEGAPLLSDLLEAAPHVKMLVTSRERLNLSIEIVFGLAGLALPEPDRVDGTLRYSAVRFFVDCAQRARHGFSLGTHDLPQVARICRLVEGMPLGILLAAMWVQLLSLPEIAEEISRSLDFLETDWRDLPERQRSLRAVFSSTWQKLTLSERDLFMKLAVFRGGFTSRAAQTVTGASLRVLAALVNKALLSRDAEGRCTVHELLRQFAAEQLNSSDQAFTVRDAHSAYYLEALRQRKNDLEGHNQIVTLEDIEIDLENIQAAWAWAAAQGHYEALGGAVHSLWLFYFMRGRYVDGEHFFAEAAETLRQAPADEPRNNVLGDILARQAHFASQTFQAAKRDQLMAESLTLTDLSGAPAAQAFRLLSANWTLAWEWRDTPASVEPALEEALNIYRELGCRWETAFTLMQLGSANWGFVKAPNPTRALHYLEKARAIFTDMGDLFGLAYTLNNIGVVNGTFLRNHEEAVRVLREGVTLRRRLGTRAGVANSLGNLALQLAVPGQLAEAEQCLQECLTLKRELGNPQDAIGFEDLGEILVRQGRFAEARPIFEEGLARVKDTTQYPWINIYLLWLARLDWLEGHYQAASARLEDWLTRNAAADKPGQQHDMVFALVLGGYIALAQGSLSETAVYCDRAARFAQERHDPWGQAVCQVVTGQLAFLEGRYPEASEALLATLHYFRYEHIKDMSLGWEEVFPISRALVTFSRVACAEGNFETARGYVRELLCHARQYAIDSFALTALVAMAELLAAQVQPERAAELAALVQTHPHTYAVDRDAAARLLKMLEPEVDQTVHERGKMLDVQAVVTALLDELEPSSKGEQHRTDTPTTA